MVTMGGVLYFIADDGVHGDELWRSDGTMGGTNMVIDLNPTRQAIIGGSIVDENPGTNFGEIVAGDEKIFFSAAVGNDEIRELYVSDGSNSGTLKISQTFDCEPQIFSNYPEFSYSGVNSISVMRASEVGFDTAYFSAFRCSYQNVVCSGEEPHISDGTETGTYQLADLFYGDTDLTTPGGGSITADLVGSQPSEFTRSGNSIYFSAKADMGAVLTDVGRELFVIDTSSPLGGVQLVKDINYGSADSSPSLFESMGGELFFTADDGISGMELWKSDGTNSGTMIVSNIAANGSSSWPGEKVAISGELFFTVDDVNNPGMALWKSDGTNAGTSLVRNWFGQGGMHISELTSFEGELYFVGDDGNPPRLWKSNGSWGGTELLHANLGPYEGDYVGDLTPMGDKLYFSAYSESHGEVLWSYHSGSQEKVDAGILGNGVRFLTVSGDKLFLVSNADNTGQLTYHWENPGPIIA